MAKYRILEDHVYVPRSSRWVAQVKIEGEGKDIADDARVDSTRLRSLTHTDFDGCLERIEAHKQTGTPCSVAWTDDPKPPKPLGFRALLNWLFA